MCEVVIMITIAIVIMVVLLYIAEKGPIKECMSVTIDIRGGGWTGNAHITQVETFCTIRVTLV